MWYRIDGKPLDEAQFEVDTTVCRGEMQKANLSGFPAENVATAYRRGQAVGEVFTGCMAQRGYVRRIVSG